MLTRRIALPIAALTALATMPVLATAMPAGASTTSRSGIESRGDRPGDPKGPDKKSEDPQGNCPTTKWTIPLEIKGLACVLLLPKPDKQGQDGGGGGGGLLG